MTAAREIDTNNCCIIQITNISPSCTARQVETLFSLLGGIEEMHLYPKEETSVVSCRSCCIRYSTPEEARLATHLTNTIFIDRAVVVGHPRFETIASERQINYSELMSPELHGHDSREDSPRSDPVMQDEIRRTIYVGNLAHETTAEQVMKFFVGCGEIKFVRMAGDQSQVSRFAFIEFTDPNSITQAIQMNGAIFGDRPLKVNYSKKAIVKPSNTLRLDPYSKESEALRRVQEASKFISEVVGTSEEHRSSRSRSHEHRRHGYGGRRRVRSPDIQGARYHSRSRSPEDYRGRNYSKTSFIRSHGEHSERPKSSERRNGHHHSREEKKRPKRAHGHKESKSEHSRQRGSEESPHRHKGKPKHAKKHKHSHEEHSSSGRKKSRRPDPVSDMEY